MTRRLFLWSLPLVPAALVRAPEPMIWGMGHAVVPGRTRRADGRWMRVDYVVIRRYPSRIVAVYYWHGSIVRTHEVMNRAWYAC